MALNSFIGSQVLITATAVTAYTETAFEAISASAWKEIGQLKSVGEIGDAVQMIEVPLLAKGRVNRIVGGVDGGSVDLMIAYDKDDEGQAIIRSGKGTNSVHILQIRDGHAKDTSRWYLPIVIADVRYAARDNATDYSFTTTVYPQTDLLGPYDSTN